MNQTDLSILQGSWKWLESGAMAYGRMVGGELKLAYRFGGVGQIFDWRQTGDTLVARFRWISGAISGFIYLKVVSAHRLEGGWWTAPEDSPHPSLEQGGRPTRGVSPCTWERQPQSEALPEWAERVFAHG